MFEELKNANDSSFDPSFSLLSVSVRCSRVVNGLFQSLGVISIFLELRRNILPLSSFPSNLFLMSNLSRSCANIRYTHDRDLSMWTLTIIVVQIFAFLTCFIFSCKHGLWSTMYQRRTSIIGHPHDLQHRRCGTAFMLRFWYCIWYWRSTPSKSHKFFHILWNYLFLAKIYWFKVFKSLWSKLIN